jgi:hypothetical protein
MIVHYLMEKAGVSIYTYKWLPKDDIALMWEVIDDAPAMVQLLSAIGEDCRPLLKQIAEASPILSDIVAHEFRWPTIEATYNAAAILCRYIPEELLCEAIRTSFPLCSFAEKLGVLL